MCTGQSDAILHPDVEASAKPRSPEMKHLWKSIAFFAIANIIALTAVAHASPMSKDEIAKLPQDKVAAIKRYCAGLYPDGEFKMRLFCEDQEFKALQTLIERDR
jgi:hypothetical protein